jgi:hypothetical protein
MCCSHLLDFCTRHSSVQDRSEFISNTPRPILSYHLVPPLAAPCYFGWRLGGGGAEFCTRYYAATHSIGTGWQEVGGRRLTCIGSTWIVPNMWGMYSGLSCVTLRLSGNVTIPLSCSLHFPPFYLGRFQADGSTHCRSWLVFEWCQVGI